LQKYHSRGTSPAGGWLSLGDEFDRFLNQVFNAPAAAGFAPGLDPAIDLYEDGDNLVVKVELPGLKKEDIAISLDDAVLNISGERRTESKATNGTVHRRERAVGGFSRGLGLPYPVNADGVKAGYTDGILTITLPKAEQAKPKQIPLDMN